MAANPTSGSTVQDIPLIHPDCDGKSNPDQTVSNFIDEKISNKILNRGDKGFLLDVIIVRLDIPNNAIDQSSKLLVDTNFNGRKFSITSSRINVLDFKPECSLEFVSNPLELKGQLTKNPLTLKVTDGANVIGYGSLEWTEEFLSGLLECAGVMTSSFEIELKKCDGTKTGTMQIAVRLQPKCDEYEEDTSPDGKCRNANKEIEPNDILFVVGEEKNNCCCSQIGIIPASESDQDLQPRCLDLSSFRPVNSQNIKNTDILSSLDPACQNLKSVTSHYQKFIDAVKTRKNQYPYNKTYKAESEIFCVIPTHSCSKIKVFPSSSDFCQPFALCASGNEAFPSKNIQLAAIDNPPELIENEPQCFRNCPICKENMEYLPKFAVCPNCCYKPILHFEEKAYDDKQNADQSLDKNHENLRLNEDSKSPQKCRCTCKYGANKPCANCRIRKLCEHIFKPPIQTSKSEDSCEPKASDICCTSGSDDRPFLTRIFSELKDLYDIEEPKKKQFEINERCEKELNKTSVTPNHLQRKEETEVTVRTEEEDKANEISEPRKSRKLRKRCPKPATELAMRSKLYDYQFVRQNRPTKIAHKTCINSYAGHKIVPSNMGWLWNLHHTSNWKPGTIRRPIKELMKYFLKDFPADTLLVSRYSYRKAFKTKNVSQPIPRALVQRPTLHVQKKDGTYIVTMRPLKRREFLKDSADPYEDMKPLQFRIVKNPQLETIRNIKKCLKSMGFKKCTCHKPIAFCYCRSFVDKKRLEYQCRKECCKRQIRSCCDTLVLTDTSDSEAEVDFSVTPPVGIIKPEKLKQINLVNVGTQYDELDWNPVPLFPRPPNKYMQMYQCAVKERETKPVMGASKADTGLKGVDGALRKGSFPKGTAAITQGKNAAAKGMGIRSDKTNTGMAIRTNTGMVIRTNTGMAIRTNTGMGIKSDKIMGIKNDKIMSSRTNTGMVIRNDKVIGIGNAKGMGTRSTFSGARGGGDGLLIGTKENSRRSLAVLNKKYGSLIRSMSKNQVENISNRKVDMLKYIKKRDKQMSKISPTSAEDKRNAKMNLLKGVNPPLLCMVDRRGKPLDPFAPCLPCVYGRIC